MKKLALSLILLAGCCECNNNGKPWQKFPVTKIGYIDGGMSRTIYEVEINGHHYFLIGDGGIGPEIPKEAENVGQVH